MTISSVEQAIQNTTDRISKAKELFRDDFSGDTSGTWNIVDGAADETYENRVKGSDLTALDVALEGGNIGTHVRQFIALHNQYFTTDLSLASTWTTYLDSKCWRVCELFADAYYEALTRRLAVRHVSAFTGTVAGVKVNQLGFHTVDTAAAAGIELDVTKLGNTPMQLEVQTVVGGGTCYAKATMQTYPRYSPDDVDTDIVVDDIAVSGASGTLINIGENSLSGNHAAAVKTLQLTDSISAGTPFVDGMFILIVQGSGQSEIQEYVQLAASGAGPLSVDGVVPATDQLNLPSTGTGLRHDFTTGAAVYPCYTKVVSLDDGTSNAATSGAIRAHPRMDRTLELTPS